MPYIVKVEGKGYYRNLKHVSHFTENFNEAEKFKSVNLANWAARTVNGEVEEITIWGNKKK